MFTKVLTEIMIQDGMMPHFSEQLGFVTYGHFINIRINPSDVAGNVTTVVTNNEYFIKFHQAH